MKKLLIYIPTYNRNKLLLKQIDALITYNLRYKINVDIYVNDNLSPFDKNLEEIISLNEKNEIIYNKNISNIGGNANILLGFYLAKNYEYLWILSDDDLVLPNVIDYIFEQIQDSPNLIHIGDYDSENSRELFSSNFFNVTKGPGFGLISNVIYKIDFFKNSIMTGFEFYHTSFPHMSILMDVLNKEKKIEFKSIKSSRVFSNASNEGISPGDYSYSYLGFVYLSAFFENKDRYQVVHNFIKKNAVQIYNYRYKSESFKIKYVQLLGFLLFSYPSVFIIFFSKIFFERIKIFLISIIRLIAKMKNKYKFW